MTPGPVSDAPAILAAPAGVTAHTAPNDVDIDAIATALRESHVYTQTPDQLPALRELVTETRQQGHDINIVVLVDRQPKFTMYRDIATELQHQLGGTVLVFGPNAAGSSSTEFSRVKLEEATDHLNYANPTVAARDMVNSITAPGIDWTMVTLVLIVVVVIGAVAARVRSLRIRAHRDGDSHGGGSTATDPTASSTSGAAESASAAGDAGGAQDLPETSASERS